MYHIQHNLLHKSTEKIYFLTLSLTLCPSLKKFKFINKKKQFLIVHDLSLIPREYRGIRTKQKKGSKKLPSSLIKEKESSKLQRLGPPMRKKRRERTYKKGLIYGLATYVKVVSAAYSAPTCASILASFQKNRTTSSECVLMKAYK